tara:strand:- start:425 stop:709 length:285 start_codon:yes stop_codon:yes gene_type:complete
MVITPHLKALRQQSPEVAEVSIPASLAGMEARDQVVDQVALAIMLAAQEQPDPQDRATTVVMATSADFMAAVAVVLLLLEEMPLVHPVLAVREH